MDNFCKIRYASRLLFILACFMMFADSAMAANEKLKIFVSILPQKYFAERLLAEHGSVDVLIDAGQSPHTYEPLPQQMGKLSRADVFFTVGVPFELALKSKIANLCPNLKIVDSDDGIEKREMLEEEHETEGHHHDEDHHHIAGEKDPHFWLDPVKASLMAENMAKTIIAIRPELRNHINGNLDTIKKEMAVLTNSLTEVLAPYKGNTMLVFHPAFGYFADRFGMIQKSVEIEGKEPTPRQLGVLIKKCREQKVKVIFVQKQFSSSTAKTIADSIGGKVIAIDPLAENYVDNLKTIADSVAGSTN